MSGKLKDRGISLLLILSCMAFMFLRSNSSFENKVINEEAAAEIERLDVARSQGQEPIVLFVTSWCGQCKNLIRNLNRHNLSFELFDIENDSQGQELYGKVMGSHSGPVPVTVVGKSVFVGNQSEEIIKAASVKKSST